MRTTISPLRAHAFEQVPALFVTMLRSTFDDAGCYQQSLPRLMNYRQQRCGEWLAYFCTISLFTTAMNEHALCAELLYFHDKQCRNTERDAISEAFAAM